MGQPAGLSWVCLYTGMGQPAGLSWVCLYTGADWLALICQSEGGERSLVLLCPRGSEDKLAMLSIDIILNTAAVQPSSYQLYQPAFFFF